jgi:hypothetical protein
VCFVCVVCVRVCECERESVVCVIHNVCVYAYVDTHTCVHAYVYTHICDTCKSRILKSTRRLLINFEALAKPQTLNPKS